MNDQALLTWLRSHAKHSRRRADEAASQWLDSEADWWDGYAAAFVDVIAYVASRRLDPASHPTRRQPVMHLIRKFLARTAISAGVVMTAGGLALTVGVAAPQLASAAQVGSQFSQTIAGTALQGNGADIINGTWRMVTVPANPDSGTPIAPDSLAVGIVLADNVAVVPGMDRAYGEALVWDDTSHTVGTAPGDSCGAGLWTLEYTPDAVDLTTVSAAGFPIPASDLEPLSFLSTPVCTPTAFMYLYQSHKHGEVLFSEGSGSKDWDVLATDHHAYDQFRTGASGVNTETGTNAGDVATGTLLASSGVGYFINGKGNSVFGQGVNLEHLNFQVFQGTVTGGPASVLNPLTLTVSGLSLPYGAYSISAP